MSAVEATRFVTRVETDAALAERLAALRADPPAVYAVVRAEGFDCTPDEIKIALLDAHGDKLTPEQLDAIAGGLSSDPAAIVVGIAAGLTAVGSIAIIGATAAAAT